jgi:hypothetical protein
VRYSDYKCFRFGIDSGVAFVSINHPPINLLDEVLSQEFDQLGREFEVDESVRVVVLHSALPDFFIAHSGLGGVGARDGLFIETLPVKIVPRTQIAICRSKDMRCNSIPSQAIRVAAHWA